MKLTNKYNKLKKKYNKEKKELEEYSINLLQCYIEMDGKNIPNFPDKKGFFIKDLRYCAGKYKISYITGDGFINEIGDIFPFKILHFKTFLKIIDYIIKF